MRSFIRNYIEAEKARREKSGEAGFSLIELIVVVVILGILAAVAIPVFLGLQAQAEDSARESVAGNAASQVASNIAKATTAPTTHNLDNLDPDSKYEFSVSNPGSIENFCVTVTEASKFAKSGPGCTAPLTGSDSGTDTDAS